MARRRKKRTLKPRLPARVRTKRRKGGEEPAVPRVDRPRARRAGTLSRVDALPRLGRKHGRRLDRRRLHRLHRGRRLRRACGLRRRRRSDGHAQCARRCEPVPHRRRRDELRPARRAGDPITGGAIGRGWQDLWDPRRSHGNHDHPRSRAGDRGAAPFRGLCRCVGSTLWTRCPARTHPCSARATAPSNAAARAGAYPSNTKMEPGTHRTVDELLAHAVELAGALPEAAASSSMSR